MSISSGWLPRATSLSDHVDFESLATHEVAGVLRAGLNFIDVPRLAALLTNALSEDDLSELIDLIDN